MNVIVLHVHSDGNIFCIVTTRTFKVDVGINTLHVPLLYFCAGRKSSTSATSKHAQLL